MLINNKYKIEQELGRGGMGTVYRAFDIETNTLVAVKETIILPSADEQRKLKRLQREYDFLKSINHPNIVRAIDFFEYQNTYYIVMEYVDGYSLESLIVEKPLSLSVEEQLNIVIQICSAIAMLNKQGVIHRDLKPANIILCKYRGIPKVLDLGIAKDMQQGQTALTKIGHTIGTLAYMSPEQLVEGASNKSDAFSLGVMFYQFFLWLPESPHQASSITAALDKITKTTLPPIIFRVPKVHSFYDPISEIVDNAIVRDVNKRIDVSEMHRAFCAILGQDVVRTSPPSKSPPSKSPLVKKNNALRITSRSRRLQQIKKRQSSVVPQKKLHNFAMKYRDYVFRVTYSSIILILAFVVSQKNSKPQVPKKNYERLAKWAYIHKKYGASISYNNKVLEANPKNANAHLAQAKAYFRCNAFKQALLAIDKAIAIKPTSEMLQSRGEIHLEMIKQKEAIIDFKKAINLNKKNIDAYKNLIQTYNDIENHRQALYYSKVAIKELPDVHSLFMHKGICFYYLEKYDEAIESYLKAIEISSSLYFYYQSIALIYRQQQKYKKAFEYISIAIDKAISKPIQMKHKVYLYEFRINIAGILKRNNIIIKDFSKLIELQPKNYEHYVNRSISFTSLNKDNSALADMNKAIDMGYPARFLAIRRGDTYYKLGKYSLAMDDFSLSIKRYPNDYEGYYKRGRCYQKLQKYNEAIFDYKKAKRLKTDFVNVYLEISQCYRKLRKYSQAKIFLQLWKKEQK
ncbi:protein kinase [Candidatus Uabimicrobium sp. HlEnr_7]|uniref:protein kinase domain-containing protein n=1 Tax=Candidatus Uabimicrobium helgolandensis TaxID=3095367 RepID=UPI0035590283